MMTVIYMNNPRGGTVVLVFVVEKLYLYYGGGCDLCQTLPYRTLLSLLIAGVIDLTIN